MGKVVGIVTLGVLLWSCGGSAVPGGSAGFQESLMPQEKLWLDELKTSGGISYSFSPSATSQDILFLMDLINQMARDFQVPVKLVESSPQVVLGLDTSPAVEALPVPLFPVKTPTGITTAYLKVSYNSPGLWVDLNRWVRFSLNQGILETLYSGTYKKSLDAEVQALGGWGAGDLVNLTPDSVAMLRLEQIWAQDKALKAAIWPQEMSYTPDNKNGDLGFDYNLILSMARSCGLSLKMTLATEIADYFERQGEMPPDLGKNPDLEYTPDLLKKVDIYPGPWGILPWREKLMTMVPLYPGRSQLISRVGEGVDEFKDLDGKTFAVLKDNYHHEILLEKAASEGIRLNFVFGRNEVELFEMVRDRKADYVLEGSLFFAPYADWLKLLEIKPFDDSVWTIGWGVKKDDPGMKDLLTEFFEAGQKSGLFGRYWAKTFGGSFQDYMNLIMTTGGGE